MKSYRMSIKQRLNLVEVHAIQLMRRVSVPFLRVTLGVVFIWFGALKIAGVTPVADFVANTVPWLDRVWFIPALGTMEVLLGIALIMGQCLSFVCLILAGHLCGTFLALVMQPSVTFQSSNLLLLTTEGEFVIKNLVLIAGVMVVAARHDLDELQFQQFIQETRLHLMVLRSLPPLVREDDLFK